MPSATSALTGARLTPKERRAPAHQATTRSPNAAKGYAASHLLPTARPQQMPEPAATAGTARRAPAPIAWVGDLGRDVVGHPGAVPVPVEHEAVHGTEQEERHEDVEQRQPREHELQTVEGEQDAGDAARAASSR